jgi:hypothetical protein
MVISASLKIFIPGAMQLHLIKENATEVVEFGYLPLKKGDNLDLTIIVIYWIKDDGKRVDITTANTAYNVETNGSITIDDIYNLCKSSVIHLRGQINLLAKIRKTHPTNIQPPPLEEIKADLQPIVDLFLKAGN